MLLRLLALRSHEPPVVAGDIKIIYDGRLPGNDGETFVIEKPGSMPVSSNDACSLVDPLPMLFGCTRSTLPVDTTSIRYYRFSNSTTAFRSSTVRISLALAHCMLTRRTIAVNRLDRLTSGVMVCSLTVENSKKLGKWFGGERAAEGGVKKEYLARCKGRFPSYVAAVRLFLCVTDWSQFSARKLSATSRCLRLIDKLESTLCIQKVE